jgi:hypothetical protein
MGKGKFNQECNRTACNKKGAVFYNHSTRMFYCPACAMLINEMNHSDAIRLYGHELCTLVESQDQTTVG